MNAASRFLPSLLTVVLAGCAGMGHSASAPTKTMNGMLTDPAGMTLYTFDKDSAGAGKSSCNGPCAANWPPLQAEDGADAGGGYTVVTRDDGTKQWAYHGKPLYRWSKDDKPGDAGGDGFRNVWHAAKP